MIVAAMLLCDRKGPQGMDALRALVADPLIDRIYLNIETTLPAQYDSLFQFLSTSGKPYAVDYWDVLSSWLPKPVYDQDQKRLVPIVRGRNMAIDYALFVQADHLLFIDSDVVPAPGGIEKLLSLNANLCGGYVPGRGVHSHVHYVFGARRGIQQQGAVITCDHGTCGYMLISRKVFGMQRFRFGADPEQMTFDVLSEDPAYCIDWYVRSGERFKIHTGATALHLDNPDAPLTDSGVSNNSTEEVYG